MVWMFRENPWNSWLSFLDRLLASVFVDAGSTSCNPSEIPECFFRSQWLRNGYTSAPERTDTYAAVGPRQSCHLELWWPIRSKIAKTDTCSALENTGAKHQWLIQLQLRSDTMDTKTKRSISNPSTPQVLSSLLPNKFAASLARFFVPGTRKHRATSNMKSMLSLMQKKTQAKGQTYVTRKWKRLKTASIANDLFRKRHVWSQAATFA